jgi:hypothetical protein
MSTHKIAIVVKFLASTNNRCARIKLILPRWENKNVVFSYHNIEGRDTLEKAENYLAAHGIVCGECLDMEDYYILTVDFKSESQKNLLKLFSV